MAISLVDERNIDPIDFLCNSDDNDFHKNTASVLEIVLRAYIRPEPNFPESKQRPSVDAAKPGAVYVEAMRRPGKDDLPQREGWIRSLRKSHRDVAGVAHFHRLAPDADDLRVVLKKIAAQGCTIRELSTGRVSTKVDDMAAMILDAMDFYAQRGLSTERATEIGELGGKASPVTKPKAGRMPHAEAIVYLNDISVGIKKAISNINKVRRYTVKWTFVYAYRERKAGRLPFADRKAGPKPKT